MKKIAAVFTAVSLTILMSTTAFAGTIDTETSLPGNVTHDIYARYEKNTQTPDVYSIDVTWGSMQFTYTESGTMTWNSEKHEYENTGGASWNAKDNTVKVTNHSNQKVTANLSYQSKNGYQEVTGSFDKTVMVLETAVGTPFDQAPEDTASLIVSGTLPDTVTDFTAIGQITVSLS